MHLESFNSFRKDTRLAFTLFVTHFIEKKVGLQKDQHLLYSTVMILVTLEEQQKMIPCRPMGFASLYSKIKLYFFPLNYSFENHVFQIQQGNDIYKYDPIVKVHAARKRVFNKITERREWKVSVPKSKKFGISVNTFKKTPKSIIRPKKQEEWAD